MKREGTPIERFDSNKVRALLAYLIIESHQPHRREVLATIFWGDKPERTARRNLSQAIYNLRQLLSSLSKQVLEVTPQTIRFVSQEHLQVDMLLFDHHLATMKQHRQLHSGVLCDDCRRWLTEATHLYRGDLLAGINLENSLAFEDWIRLKREIFRREIIEALYTLADGQQQQGNYEDALKSLDHLLEIDPLQEQAYRKMMRLLAVTERRSEALRRYERCRQILWDELGVEPEADTQTLYHHLASTPDNNTDLRNRRNDYLRWTPLDSQHWNNAQTLEVVAQVERNRGDYASARARLDEALQIYEATTDHAGTARVLTLMGLTARDQGRFLEAERLIRQARTIYFDLGDRYSVAQAEGALGRLLTFSGKFSQAVSLIQSALAIYRTMGLHQQETYFSIGLALHLLLMGDYEEARVTAQRGMQLSYAIQDQLTICFGMSLLGAAAIAQDRLDQAENLLNHALVLANAVGRPEELGSILANLGYLLVKNDELARARIHLLDGLQLVSKSHNFASAMFVLPAAALFLHANGETKRASNIHAVCARFAFFHRSAYFSLLFEPTFGKVTQRRLDEASIDEGIKHLWSTVYEVATHLRGSGYA